MVDEGGFHPLEVASVDALTDDAALVSFSVPPALAQEFRFRPGQHLALRRCFDGEEVRRTYSICAPVGQGDLRVAVKRLDGGRFSTWATTELRAGDVIDVLPPAGSFTYDVEVAPGARRIAAIAAGSGITPLLSIVSSALEACAGTTVTLLYGNRTTADVMFLEELADLKDRFAHRFTLLHVLSQEASEVELCNGRIDGPKLRRLLDGLVPPETVDAWYLCGPFAMVTELRGVLAEAGVDRRNVHTELFYAGQPTAHRRSTGRPGPAEGTTTVTVSLHGRSTTLTMSRGDASILDTLLAARPDAPYACKGGVCGTCRARVVDGAVEMDRSHALEEAEVAAGLVLTCQSRPTTDTVTLIFG